MIGVKLLEKRPAVSVSAVIPAVMDIAKGEDPLYRLLEGQPVIAHTLQALDQISAIDEIVLVVRESELFRMAELCQPLGIGKLKQILHCDQPGLMTLLTGVYACARTAEYIAIHDPLRPFVTEKIIGKTLKAARRCNAVAPAIPVKDTIKIVQDGTIRDTLDRDTLQTIQTPQIIQSSLLKAALERAMASESPPHTIAEILAHVGLSLPMIKGSDDNIRITSEADIPAAQGILTWRATL
ncbi:MAG: 2-C-methyl-D-erythritol 4-phosphate cytidylyltransferase [Oscillospiraceae bacterium]|nr:2-C-methyl-D-erythritol 4-phosphate cytidylyltransferase [Oscillospiraceae bacterium]